MTDMDDAWFELNRTWWDERVAVHVTPTSTASTAFWQVTPLRAYEIEEAGDVSGLDLVHLQCHFGMDTLGWARLGARVVGVDLQRAGDPCGPRAGRAGGPRRQFEVANVYDAPATLRGQTFDRVYTGIGALCWLPDIDAWARVVDELLRPGGRLHLVEFHPVTHWSLSETDLTVKYSYFHEGPWVWDDDPDEPPLRRSRRHLRAQRHRRVEPRHRRHRHGARHGRGCASSRWWSARRCFMQRWPFMVEVADQDWRIPPELPQIPLSFSLIAREAGGPRR